jgi:hypothetical protein
VYIYNIGKWWNFKQASTANSRRSENKQAKLLVANDLKAFYIIYEQVRLTCFI